MLMKQDIYSQYKDIFEQIKNENETLSNLVEQIQKLESLINELPKRTAKDNYRKNLLELQLESLIKNTLKIIEHRPDLLNKYVDMGRSIFESK